MLDPYSRMKSPRADRNWHNRLESWFSTMILDGHYQSDTTGEFRLEVKGNWCVNLPVPLQGQAGKCPPRRVQTSVEYDARSWLTCSIKSFDGDRKRLAYARGDCIRLGYQRNHFWWDRREFRLERGRASSRRSSNRRAGIEVRTRESRRELASASRSAGSSRIRCQARSLWRASWVLGRRLRCSCRRPEQGSLGRRE